MIEIDEREKEGEGEGYMREIEMIEREGREEEGNRNKDRKGDRKR